MLPDFSKDGIIKALIPGVKQVFEPAVLQARAALLRSIAGTAPQAFIDRLKEMYDFSHEENQKIWLAAIEGAAQRLANGS